MEGTSGTRRPARVLVADASGVTREAIAAVLRACPEFEVVGCAATMEETLRLVRELAPDVLVVDPWLFGPGGPPGCLVAKRLRPGMTVVALVPDARDEYPRAARAVGVDLWVPKESVGRDLPHALRAALSSR
jgi:DNA-binding NarL/FixJ family response regulator